MTRFRVTSITGWSINPRSTLSGTKQPAPAWYVLDSASCHQIVREFRSVGNQWRRGEPELDAHAFGAELEREYP